MSLKGKTVFIAGGCKNLGALVASQFAAEGANLALHYNSESTKPSAEKLLGELTKAYSTQQFRIYQADLSTASYVQKLYADILRDFGGNLDIVINTVGQVLKKPLIEISEAEYDSMTGVNSKAAFFITQEAAKHVKDGGKIINIVTSLLAAYTGYYSSYQGTKAPVEYFTKGLSKELMSRSISVNAIAPGPMDTPFFYGQESPEAVEFHKSNAIGGRLTKIEDIAPIVKFLCTDGAWINGERRSSYLKCRVRCR
jgi:NAD(P)-dependent dehydrogenase (short-subunit alcohol dehydrogenase family)